MISDLRQVIAEQEKDLACINEEKRYYQMKLMSIQRSMEEEDEDFVDSEDFDAIDSKDRHREGATNGFTAAQTSQQIQNSNTLAIPPTILECDEWFFFCFVLFNYYYYFR